MTDTVKGKCWENVNNCITVIASTRAYLVSYIHELVLFYAFWNMSNFGLYLMCTLQKLWQKALKIDEVRTDYKFESRTRFSVNKMADCIFYKVNTAKKIPLSFLFSAFSFTLHSLLPLNNFQTVQSWLCSPAGVVFLYSHWVVHVSIAFSLFYFMTVSLTVKLTVSVSLLALWGTGPVWNSIPECTQLSSHHGLLCGSGVSKKMCHLR